MSVSPVPRPHAHTSLGAPSSSLRSRIPQPSPGRPLRSPSRADNVLGVEIARPRSASPRPAPLTHTVPVRNRDSVVASEDSFGQTVFLNRAPPRTSSLSRPPTRLEIPSSPDDPLFYHPPQPTFPLPHSRSALHQRESMITQSSSLTASSIYPASSSSQTGPDSPPSPSTPSAHSSIDPVQTPGFAVDADDVSYRLRLLVRNNYFLPPAHSKPNHSELSLLSVSANPAPTKTPSPTFRDLFRVRPRTPSKSGPESPKTTKAPVTVSPVVRPPMPVRTSTMPALVGSTAPSLREKERRGRVLVIRERLDDLVTAANAAEIDMRAREDDRKRREPPNSAPNPALAAVDLIDPTETVDLPSYMFPVQSSLAPFGGLDVGNSLGAAALADALPPRVEDKEDEAWRKALLHKAVGLSMLSIPEPTPPPSQRSVSTSSKSPASVHSSSASGSGSKPGSALPSPNPALGRSIISGSRLNNLTPVSPLKGSGIRSPGFATRSPNTKTRELPIGSGSSPSSSSPGKSLNPSLPPPPRARTASKNSLSPRPSQGAEKPSMLPVPKHTVRRALSTPMLAQKVGTAAGTANSGASPPLQVQSPGKNRLKPGLSTGQRSVTMSGLHVNTGSGSRAPTPTRSARATTPISRAQTPSIDRAPTPSIARSPMTSQSRAPTPSPALMVETPEGQTVLPTRDTLASLTSGSNYSDDEEIVAVDDDDDEIIAVDDDDEERERGHHSGREYADPPEEMEDDMRAPSRAGVMLRPDSRMTNATVVRPSFHESRAVSRMSNTMSAFGGLDLERSLSPPVGPSSQRNSIAMHPKRSSTLMSEVTPGTPLTNGPSPSAKNQSPPLNVRRSQVIAPLSLQPPATFASTVASLRSAPPPASTDFFDAVYTRSLAHGGLGFDSDSEETEPEPPVPIFVQTRSRAVSTTSMASSRSKASRILGVDLDSQPAVMHFASSSNPYLATDPNPYQGLDPRKPVTNTPPASQTKFKAMNLLRPATSMGLRSSGRKSPHLIQHPAIRAGKSGESIRTTASTTGGRAARSEESIATTSTRRQNQDPSLSRLDGLYATHIQAERDRMKRITSSAASSAKKS